jgi:hypothetical protein
MKKQVFYIFLISLIFMVVLSSCVTPVRIDSDVPAADVFINGEKVGKTPTVVELSDFIFSNYDVVIEKEGYTPYYGSIRKEFKTGRFIWGFFGGGITWPWVYGPKPYQTFYLNEIEK